MVITVAAVQFVNILDFMIVMPLGPDFAAGLGIPLSRLGFIGGSYMAAAAVAGLAGSLFMDRFDRRSALITCLAGLSIATALCAAASSLTMLMAARLLAGAFGGPATSLSISIVADIVPAERRGKAMGIVMSAFSAASVMGVPAGLEIARLAGWRMTFIFVAVLGVAASFMAFKLLPRLRGHMTVAARKAGSAHIWEIARRPAVIFSMMMAFSTMMGAFSIIPNLAAYFLGNLGFPRNQLGLLYLGGGILSFAVLHLSGAAVDKLGAFRVGTVGSFVLLVVLYFGFFNYRTWIPVALILPCFMLAMSIRNVAYNTITSRVPAAAERARFLSLRSAVQHMAAACGAFLSSKILTETPDGALVGMPLLTVISMSLIATLPVLFWIVERMVDRQDRAALMAREAAALEGGLDAGQ